MYQGVARFSAPEPCSVMPNLMPSAPAPLVDLTNPAKGQATTSALFDPLAPSRHTKPTKGPQGPESLVHRWTHHHLAQAAQWRSSPQGLPTYGYQERVQSEGKGTYGDGDAVVS
eukprot:scaffold95261_cov17-Tisochrysis_lutea.AAC.1